MQEVLNYIVSDLWKMNTFNLSNSVQQKNPAFLF